MTPQLAISFECTPVRETHIDADERSPVEPIVATIAEMEGVDPVDLPPIAQNIDPDIINKFINRGGMDSEGGLCFTYCGWNVFIRTDGTVIIGDPDMTSEPTPLF